MINKSLAAVVVAAILPFRATASVPGQGQVSSLCKDLGKDVTLVGQLFRREFPLQKSNGHEYGYEIVSIFLLDTPICIAPINASGSSAGNIRFYPVIELYRESAGPHGWPPDELYGRRLTVNGVLVPADLKHSRTEYYFEVSSYDVQ